MKYAFYPGCVARGGTPELLVSANAVLDRLGIEREELVSASCTGAGVLQERNQKLGDTLEDRYAGFDVERIKSGELKKMLAESILKIRVLEEFNAKKWQARRRKSRPLSTWSTKGCAQCVGPVAIWACIGRPTAITPNHRCLNRSNSTSVLSRCLGNIPAKAIAASGRYWRGKAGRLAASKSSASGGNRA